MTPQQSTHVAKHSPIRAGKTGMVSIKISYRTMKQWRRCARLGRLLGLTQDEVLAEALRIGLRSLIRMADKQGVDWRSVSDDPRSDQAIRRETGEPAARPMPDTHPEDWIPPMIDD